MTQLNLMVTAKESKVVWLYEGKLYDSKAEFEAAALTLMSGERTYACTNILANFERPHEAIYDKCVDYLAHTNIQNKHYRNVAAILHDLSREIGFPPIDGGAVCLNYVPSRDLLHGWTTRALAADGDGPGLPENFEVPEPNPRVRCLSDVHCFFKYMCFLFECPLIATTINVQDVMLEIPEFHRQVTNQTITRETLKVIRRFARNGQYDIQYVSAIFIGRLENFLGPFFICNPAYKRPIWEVIELIYNACDMIQNLHNSIELPVCEPGVYLPFIPRRALSLLECTRDSQICVDYPVRRFVTPEDDEIVGLHVYSLRFLRPFAGRSKPIPARLRQRLLRAAHAIPLAIPEVPREE